MYTEKPQLTLINSTAIRNLIGDAQFANRKAGFVQNGSYAWIVRESALEILSTESGSRIAHYNFGKHQNVDGCLITFVEEIEYLPNICLLAVTTEYTGNGASAATLSIFCVQGSKILGSMDFCERITCCRYVPESACKRSVLMIFHGAMAIGTDQGKLFLIDLKIPSSVQEIAASPSYETDLFPCVNILADVDQQKIAAVHKKTTPTSTEPRIAEKSFFSIQLKVLNDSGSILSILIMPNLYTMAVGHNDGRMVLYDLIDLQAFHLAYPPKERTPLTHMSFLEPTDDPRCAVYVWAFHASKEGAIAVMHSLMFASKVDGIYEDFKSCSVRLTMPMFMKDSSPICCRSITRTLTQDEEDILTLNVFAWTSSKAKRTNVMIFDLNQWYKEEMPSLGDWRHKLKYMAVFGLQNCTALDVTINDNSVFPFNSIMRPEEHFYPDSLSFDVSVLENDRISHYRWFGVQNIVLQQFNIKGPEMILEPNYYFNELLQVAIVPQFSDAAFHIATPLAQKREFLLSVALEYNFNGFLKKCAMEWADGSYLGKDESTGIGLSTLTDWIWNRARAIKDICNSLCQPLFDYSEQRIDYGTQKQLSQCCKQLKVLSELLIIILKDFHQYIPDHIYVQLTSQSDTIKMASDYQEVLQWLLNVGLLPEGQYDSSLRSHHYDNDFLIVPYPYQVISSYYSKQREKLANEWNSESGKTSIFLFIDAFIEKECYLEKLREIWGGVYPPKSIQALLRTLLIPEIPMSSKHVIFVYLFMDITRVLSDGAFASIVRNLIKFPAVFKMNPAMIKRTQAFWNLDNGNLDTAVEELISPLSHDKHLPLWQRELLIGALLKQNANSLALRALRCPGNQISSDLEMLTLLANNLISEALKVQRASGDRKLLEKLFEKILFSSNYEQLLDLTLTEDEGTILSQYLNKLKDSGLPNHLNIHFVFLLQRAKFIDAAHLVESFEAEGNVNLEPPKQVLNAYYATMESTTRRLTSMAYKEEVQVKESPMPLSVSLIRSRCNMKNDIYQQCVQSITEAAYDSNQEVQKLPFIGSPKLGIFEYKQPAANCLELSYCIEVNEHGKRKPLKKDEQFITLEDIAAPQSKKRRLNDSILPKRKSYKDTRLSNITSFKETKPSFNFTRKISANSSLRTTPERVQPFGDFLSTPIVQKKTPQSLLPDKCPATPQSILKTRSCRGSVSPAPSRFSEFGDDNKSVKSITFAPIPDSRDTSFNDSSMLEESFNEEQEKSQEQEAEDEQEPMETSAEIFYSPGKSPESKATSSRLQSYHGGPKPRKPLSRSTTPVEHSQNPIPESKEGEVLPTTPEKEPEAIGEAATAASSQDSEPKLDDTVVSSGSDNNVSLFHHSSVLKDYSSNYESSEESDSSVPDKSIYGWVRKSVLPADFDDSDYTTSEDVQKKSQEEIEESEDSEIVADEHFEEEELPEHSDYDDSSENDEDGFEYGDVDLEDSNESSSKDEEAKEKSDEVICLDSSSDEEAVVETPAPALPSFGVLASNDDEHLSFADLDNVPSDEPPVVTSPEDIYSCLYDDLDQQNENVEEIESPPYEVVLPLSKDEKPEQDDAGDISMVSGELISIKSGDAISVTSGDVISVTSGDDVVSVTSMEVKDVEEKPMTTGTTDVEETKPGTSQAESEASQVEPEDLSKPKEPEILGKEPENPGKEPEDLSKPKAAENPGKEPEDLSKSKEPANSEKEPEDLSKPKKSENPAKVSENLGSSLSPPETIAPESRKSDLPNSSGFSEDSFVSASGGELNEAGFLLRASAGRKSSRGSEDTPDESVKSQYEASRKSSMLPDEDETVNPLDQALIGIDMSASARESVGDKNETLKTSQSPIKVYQTRSRAASTEPVDRQTRGKSVPSNPSSPRSRSQRASTEDPENPKNLWKAKTLERIEEVDTPVKSPGILTRRRSQLLESGEAQATPQTPTRGTRRRSTMSEDGMSEETPTKVRRLTRATSRENLEAAESPEQTIRRSTRAASRENLNSPDEPGPSRKLTRAASKESLKTINESPDEPGTLTRQPSLRSRKRTTSASDNEDAKSTRSTRSTKAKTTPSSSTKVTPEKMSPVESSEELSVTNRRLTRRQLEVIEKSRKLTEKLASASALRPTKSDSIKSNTNDDDSDNESVKSESASTSSRTSRKRRNPRKASKEDDSSSVASKSSRKSMSPGRKPKLSVIPEESHEDSSSVTSSTRSKKTSTKK